MAGGACRWPDDSDTQRSADMNMRQTFAIDTGVIHPNDYNDINCISIDPEFQNLIPAISDEERGQLEENICAAGGVRDPLTLWLRDDNDWVILDGHNRFEICQRLKMPFPYHQVEFDTRDEAADWIDKNQLGRRNLDARQMSLLRGRRYNRTKKGHGGVREPSAQNEHLRTAEALAGEHGVSPATIRRDGEFAEAVEALGIELEIVAGEIDAPKHEIVAAANSLAENPSEEQRKAAQQSVTRGAKKAKKKSSRKGKQPTPAAKPKAVADDVANQIRVAAVKFWQKLKDKFALDEHAELRRVMADIISEEQKQASK
jgi:hypothetical protein